MNHAQVPEDQAKFNPQQANSPYGMQQTPPPHYNNDQQHYDQQHYDQKMTPYPAYSAPIQAQGQPMQAITNNHSYIAYCCCAYTSNTSAVKAISCFLICQCLIDIIFAIATFAVFFRVPKNDALSSSTLGWIIFIYILVWFISSLGSIITHFMARYKFSQGGQYGITKTTLVFATIANCCGLIYYLAMLIIFALLGLAIGGVNNHPAFQAARAILIIVAACFIPIVILFISQIVAGCKAFTQAEELPGGPRSYKAGGGVQAQIAYN